MIYGGDNLVPNSLLFRGQEITKSIFDETRGEEMKKIMSLLIFCIFILYPFLISQLNSENTPSISWQQPKELVNSDGEDGLSRMLKLDNGEIWLVWMSNREGNNEIYLKKQLNDGKWTDTVNLTNNPSDDRMPFLFQDNSDCVWLLWTTNRKGNFDIYYQIYSKGKWSTPKPLTYSHHWDEYATGCSTNSGQIWITWNSYQCGNDDIYYVYGDEKSLKGPVRVTKDKAEDRFPFVFQSNDGKIWIFWSSDRDGNWEIYFKRYSPPRSLETKEPVRFTFDTSIDSTPYVIQTEDNRLWVFWTSNRDGGSIYYKYSDDGEHWSTPEKLGNIRGYILPSAVETENREIFLASTRKSGNHYSVYTICSEFKEKRATLLISSSPSASVYINNNYKGETPLDLELESGKYTVRIEKENYEPYTETIELHSGESKNLSVDLTRITPPPTASTSTAPTYAPPTTAVKSTTLPPTTTSPQTTMQSTSVPTQSRSLLYLGIPIIVICIFGIYLMTKRRSEKEHIKKIKKEKLPEDKLKKSKEISPELQELLQKKEEWKKKLEELKGEKDNLLSKGIMTKEEYQKKYEEIIDKLVDIEDKIIKEKMKRGKKK